MFYLVFSLAYQDSVFVVSCQTILGSSQYSACTDAKNDESLIDSVSDVVAITDDEHPVNPRR